MLLSPEAEDQVNQTNSVNICCQVWAGFLPRGSWVRCLELCDCGAVGDKELLQSVGFMLGRCLAHAVR